MRHPTDLVQSLRASVPQRNNSIGYPALLIAGLACVLQTAAFAQQPATISGFLADASGAGVPNAGLTLTNQDTAVVTMTATSDSSGNFTFRPSPRRAPTRFPSRSAVSRGAKKKISPSPPVREDP